MTIDAVLGGGLPWHVEEGDALGVLRRLPAGCVDAVVTDPPYGIGCGKVGAGTCGKGTFHRYTTPGAAAIAGDGEVDGRWLAGAFRALRRGGYLFSFSRWDVDHEWRREIDAAGFRLKNRAVWAKAHFGSGDLKGAFGFQYESVWVASKGRGELKGGRTGDVWHDGWTECIRHGKRHPFEKPVDLMHQIVRKCTDPGQLVLDPFCGSGTTGVACLREGRRFLGVELSPDYAAIARRRIREDAPLFATAPEPAAAPTLFDADTPEGD
jgi:site-specific DNA-methyltransferase (adenine-specific)